MLTAESRRQSLSTIPVSELVHYLTGENQKAFVRLRLALGLNLRRQLLIAVCDDLALRNAMAEKLAHDLPRLRDLSSFIPLELGVSEQGVKTASTDQLLTMTLHPKDATQIGQVVQGLKRDPQKPRFGVQLLGIEQLTRQPVHIQRAFLNHLRAVGRNFVHLDSNMLLWVTRPWLRSIQQSAPEFWRWRTGIFEFEGDPLPAGALANYPAITEKPKFTQPDEVPAASLLPLIQSSVDRLTKAKSTEGPAKAQPIFEPDLPQTSDPSELVPASEQSGQTAVPIIQTPAQPPIDHPNTPPDRTPAEPPIVTTALVDAAIAEAQLSESLDPAGDVFGNDQLTPGDQALDPTLAAKAELSSTAVAQLRTESETEPLSELDLPPLSEVAAPAHDLSHLEPSQEELDLADLVLAAVMQQVSRHPEALAQTETPNLEHASFEPIRILQQVEDLQQQAAVPSAFAAVYRQLGDYYRNHHELTLQEDTEVAGRHLMVGIKSYELAWKFLDQHDPTVPEIHNDIANLYWMLSRTPGEADNSLSHLETAIARYQQAIDLVDPVANPYTCAMLENNLGAAYSDLAVRRDPMDNLNKSIAAYESALRKRPAAVEPRRYAATQNNLGTAYWNLGQHQALVPNLQRAISAYGEALKIYNPEEEPLHYAMIQNNIGTAYWNLAQCDLDTDQSPEQVSATPEDLLRLAIGAYRIALIYRTPETVPTAHAATQNNLGTAYWHLANQPATRPEEVQAHLLAAMEAYQVAIRLSETVRQPLPFDLAATRNNLASAYHQAATNRHAQLDKATRVNYLNQAINQHLGALQGWEIDSELHETALHGLVQTIRSIHEYQGSQGQTQALSKLPAAVLTSVMKRL